jgi:hypothetical protein
MTQPPFRHSGGCAFCRWIRVINARWRCTHSSYPSPTDWADARDDDTRCGSRGRYWEEIGERPA